MQKKKRFNLFPEYFDNFIFFSVIILIIIGTLMIISTEMGMNAGEMSIVFSNITSQAIYTFFGLVAIFIFSHFRLFLRLKIKGLWALYFIGIVALLATRLFGETNGAYAWIYFGGFSFQPSELAKVYMIVFGARLLTEKNVDILKNFYKFAISVLVYTFIILFIQHDLGSAVVLFGVSYIIALIPSNKELNKVHKIMLLVLLGGLVLAIFLLSPIGTKLLTKIGENDYRIGRFLASANPFLYQYDSGYQLIMGLVSFATGGWFGVGYGQSIHKYMNFPNPSTDYILPVIVEELGVVFGLIPILLLYGIIFWRLMKHSLHFNGTDSVSSKMILMGTFAYLGLHFVLNVGGVTGLIPLTGVPLLLISRGGSSLFSFMVAIGLCEGEIVYNTRKEKQNENNSRQI